jgi:hypothetical protein
MFWTNIDTFLTNHFLELCGNPTKQDKGKLANSLKNHFWWYFEETKFTNIKKFFKQLVDNILCLHDIDDYIQIIVTDTHFFGSFRDDISCIKILSYKLYCEELLQTCLIKNEENFAGYFNEKKKTNIETKIRNIKLVLRSFFNNKRIHELASCMQNGGTTSELLVTTNGSIQTTTIPFDSGSIIIESSCGIDKKTYCFIVQDISFDLNKDKKSDCMKKFYTDYGDDITYFLNVKSSSMLDTIEEGNEDSRLSSTPTVPAMHSEQNVSAFLSRTGDTIFMNPAAGGKYPDPNPFKDDSSTSTIDSIHSDEEDDNSSTSSNYSVHSDNKSDEYEEEDPLLNPNQVTTDEINPLNSSMTNPYRINNFIGQYNEVDVE